MNVMEFYFKKFKNPFIYYNPTTVDTPQPIPSLSLLTSTEDPTAPSAPPRKEQTSQGFQPNIAQYLTIMPGKYLHIVGGQGDPVGGKGSHRRQKSQR